LTADPSRKRWLVGAAAVFGLSAGLAAVIGACYWMWWDEYFYTDVVDAIQRGGALGDRTDQQGCLDTSLASHRDHRRSPARDYADVVFLSSCLEAAERAPEFCAALAPAGSAAAARQWVERRCMGDKPARDACVQLMAPVVDHCKALGDDFI